jgi:DNA mismatch repair protein MLH1
MSNPHITLHEVFIRAGVEVDWTDERQCFDSFLRELAFFYLPVGPSRPAEGTNQTSEKWQIQHVLFPALKLYLDVPESLVASRAVLNVASLESLYKVSVALRAPSPSQLGATNSHSSYLTLQTFERC